MFFLCSNINVVKPITNDQKPMPKVNGYTDTVDTFKNLPITNPVINATNIIIKPDKAAAVPAFAGKGPTAPAVEQGRLIPCEIIKII